MSKRSICPIWLLSMVLAVPFVSSAPAQAQQGSASDRAVSVAESATSDPIASPSLGEAGLDILWRGYRLVPDDSVAEEEAFSALNAARLELGLDSLPRHAMVLLREAERAWDEGRSERAERLTAWALTLAPTDPAPHFAHAAYTWQHRPWRLPTLVGELITAHRLAMNSPNNAAIFGYTWHRILLVGWIALAVVFVVVQLYRYFNLASYDLSSMTAHHIGLRWIRLGLVLMVALPALILGGPLIAIMLLLGLIWLYQNRAERIISIGLLAIIGLLPMWVGQMGRWVACRGTDSAFLYRAENDICDPYCESRLDELARQHPTDKQIAFTRAMVWYRNATERDMEAAWDLLNSHQYQGQLEAVADLLRGNLLVLRNQRSAARLIYEGLIDAQSTPRSVRAAAHFNLFRVLEEEGHPDAESHLTSAQNLEHHRIVELVQGSARRAHRYLMNVGTPPSLFIERALAHNRPMAEVAALEIWRPLAGSMSPRATPVVAGAFLLLMLGLLASSRRFQASRACPKCSRVMSRRESPKAAAAGYCQDCYDLFMEGASLDPTRRAELEQRVDRNTAARRWVTVVGNVLFGGLGFLVRGSTWLGIALVLLVILGIALWACPPPGVAVPFAWGSVRFDGRALLAAVFLLAGFGASWVITWLRRRRI